MGAKPAGPFLAGSLRRRPVAGYAFAMVATGLAFGLRLLFDRLIPPGYPFLTFFPALVLTCYFAGVGPGIASALLAAAGAWYLLATSASGLALNPAAALLLAFFAMVTGVIIAVFAAMQRAVDDLETERRLTARLHAQQQTLFQELQHRVANNMSFISSLLRLQKRRIAAEPASASLAFDEAVLRIETMARVHRRLYDAEAAKRALQVHLQDLCAELLVATGTKTVVCLVDVPELRLELDRLLPFSLLVAELVTNSIKHAFVGRSSGTIAIRLDDDPATGPAITISDDGVGLPHDHDPQLSPGLGMRIIEGLALQFGGTISMTSERGTATRISLAK